MATNAWHPRFDGCVRFVLYDPHGAEIGIYGRPIDLANVVVGHANPEHLMVRGVSAAGARILSEPALEFAMTVFD